ncbi:MAG: phosphoadenosine phosphosulfate reductase family protein [Candidatus Nezhaarchaeota archaeon]|nr:phosphoadenosine phosphosulfate reductase family protein [Candidatus Nezhaarchaeota archaeon]
MKPLFSSERLRLSETVRRIYGEEALLLIVPEDNVLLLNKIPHVDLAYEVIVDGSAVGIWRFELKGRNWSFIPYMEGARRLAQQRARKWVMVDGGAERAIVSRGSSLLAPGVVEYDTSICSDDYVYVINEHWKAVAVGKATQDFYHNMERGRGPVVKIRRTCEPRDPQLIGRKATWKDVVEANKSSLEEKERKAIELILEVCTGYDKPILVSFSGGKDSLAALLLVKKALSKIGKEYSVVFSDTGIEYPETKEYVEEVLKSIGLRDKLIKVSGPVDFFKAIELFGPPARDFRWCCKTCKLAPLARVVKELGGECLTFIGSRSVESSKRKRQGWMWKSIWVKGQRGVSPIYDWSTLDVWLYLIKEGVKVNPLYLKGLERIGCWVCPSMDVAEMMLAREIMGEAWTDYARRAYELMNLDDYDRLLEQWRWRFKQPVRNGRGRGEFKGGQHQYLPVDEDCVAVNGGDRFESVLSVLRVFYDVSIQEGKAILRLGRRVAGELTRSDSKILVKSKGNDLYRIFRCVARAVLCTKCMLCTVICPHGAAMLSEEGAPYVVHDNCVRCGECSYMCPVWAYSLKSPHIAKKLLD